MTNENLIELFRWYDENREYFNEIGADYDRICKEAYKQFDFLNLPIVSFSLRDKFAMMAMGGLTSATEQDGTWTGNVPEIVSEEAYNIADAMIKARSNKS
jgi:hypothetical protein